MGTAEGVDYAWARPDPSVLAARGKRFAVRYLSYSTTGKNLTRGEAEALWREGVWTVLVWEATTDAPLGGFVRGAVHATEAVEQARRLGAPSNVVIYFAVDFNPTTAQLSTINAYFDGVCSVIPWSRVGVYGGLKTIVAAKSQAWARFLWQTYAWSGGVWHGAAHARQYKNGVTIDGADCDLDLAMVDYIGQWNGEGIVPDWEETDMRIDQWEYLNNLGKTVRSMADGEDFAPQVQAAGEVLVKADNLDLGPYWERVAKKAAGMVTLSTEDLDAIATRVVVALRGEILSALAALAEGKAGAADSSAASGS